nr:MAG TPA: hypothetical protein [Caudoviricetes sp.]DAY44705.1 MAG TPA: hypothetical protein [Caudoviricetes sp.]
MASDICIENAKLFFLNFSGATSRYNKEGRREFSTSIPLDLVDDLVNDGWNIKYGKDRDRNPDPEKPYITVKVRYDFKPPAIWMITGGKKVLLSEDTVGSLDSVAIKTADIVVSPHAYEIKGNKGISAYLKEAYITIDDETASFASKYADLDV